MTHDLIVAGGAHDPNVQSLLRRAEALGLSALPVIFDTKTEPLWTWDLQAGSLHVDGAPVEAKGIFIRFDVFTPPAEQTAASAEGSRDRATAWFTALMGWATVSGIRMFNRHHSQAAALKPYALHLASQAGLPIPRTRVTNAQADVALNGGAGQIVKPAGGGAYTCHATDLLEDTDWSADRAPAPAFVQEALVYPEYRVYVVGDQTLAFETYSSEIDFRMDRASDTRFLPEGLDPAVLEKLVSYAHSIGLDFCAFDLKTRASTGELCFLEVNSSPMFTAFDALAEGRLSEAILMLLAGRAGQT